MLCRGYLPFSKNHVEKDKKLKVEKIWKVGKFGICSLNSDSLYEDKFANLRKEVSSLISTFFTYVLILTLKHI